MISIILKLLGLIIVPIGLLLSKTIEGTTKPYAHYPEHGNHSLVLIPDWLAPWSNLVDGTRGDKRGWYHNEFQTWSEFARQYWWTAIRNSTNYYSRFYSSIDISKCTTELLYGKQYIDEDTRDFGYQLLRATDKETGKKYYSFLLIKPLTDKKYYMMKIGYKFSLGEEFEDFGPLANDLKLDYKTIKEFAIKYAQEGYLKGDHIKAISKFKGSTYRFIPTVKDF